MGLTKSQSQSNGSLVFLSPRSKNEKGEKVSPYFQVSRVVDGKIVKTDETATQVNGNLIKMDFKEREFKGNKNKHVVIYLRDDAANETYSLDLTYKLPTRSLFNTIINLKTFENLSISYYESKKGFDTYFLRQNDQKVGWKFPLDQQPAPVSVSFKGKTMNDYTDLDNFFEKELQEVAKRIGTKSTSIEKDAHKQEKEVLDETIPF